MKGGECVKSGGSRSNDGILQKGVVGWRRGLVREKMALIKGECWCCPRTLVMRSRVLAPS